MFVFHFPSPKTEHRDKNNIKTALYLLQKFRFKELFMLHTIIKFG